MGTERLVVVYGATGYTGRQVARELVRRGIRTAIAGRSRERLAALARELDGAAEVRVAPLDDPGALRALGEEAAVVVNTSGPYTRTGPPLVRAALAGRAHHVDLSGEHPYLRWAYEQDAAAREAGVTLLPCAAISGGLGGLAAAAALGHGAPAGEVDVAVSIRGWRPSWATLQARLEGMRAPWYVHDRGELRERRGWPRTEWFDFPAPIGRRRVGVYPAADVFQVPRSVRAERVRTLLTTSTLSPLGPLLPAVANTLNRLPGRRWKDRLLAAQWKATGEGAKTDDPTPFTTVVRVDGEIRAVLSGRGIYDVTAPFAAEAAQRLLAPGYDRSGALAPAEAFDAADFLAALERRGVRYETPARSAVSSSNRASGSSSASPSSSRSLPMR